MSACVRFYVGLTDRWGVVLPESLVEEQLRASMLALACTHGGASVFRGFGVCRDDTTGACTREETLVFEVIADATIADTMARYLASMFNQRCVLVTRADVSASWVEVSE